MFTYTYDDLFNPTLQALHSLNGSGTIQEIEEQVSKTMNLSDEDLSDIHRGNKTKFSYRLAWARTYLKRYGLIDNSLRGVWSLTSDGSKTRSVNQKLVTDTVKGQRKDEFTDDDTSDADDDEVSKLTWQEELLDVLQNISADQFERLCQRMLRELGFINVEVTGRSGDGGIDGKGVLRLSGVLSFPVVFQCKRYKGSVSPSAVRDFRGSMIGRADKGLFFTTGTFSREAVREAQRDGAPPIDLMDGYQFADSLRNLGLGVDVHRVERVTVKKDWFDSI